MKRRDKDGVDERKEVLLRMYSCNSCIHDSFHHRPRRRLPSSSFPMDPRGIRLAFLSLTLSNKKLGRSIDVRIKWTSYTFAWLGLGPLAVPCNFFSALAQRQMLSQQHQCAKRLHYRVRSVWRIRTRRRMSAHNIFYQRNRRKNRRRIAQREMRIALRCAKRVLGWPFKKGGQRITRVANHID